MKYKVGVVCPTYNQKQYIGQTLDGFCMQQTTFPYLCCIMDDASTDGNAEFLTRYLDEHFECRGDDFIRQTDYAEVRFARHRDNPHCHFVVLLLRENHYSQGKATVAYNYMAQWLGQVDYLADCEGDDYWTDPAKLELQARFLDDHPDYAVCFSNVQLLDAATGQISGQHVSATVAQTTTITDLARLNYIATPTTLIRYDASYFERLHQLKGLPMADYPLWLMAAERGSIYKFEQPMAVYRQGSGSWSSTSITYRMLKVIDLLHLLPEVIQLPEVRPAFEQQIEEHKKTLIDLFDQLETDRQNVRREYEHVVELCHEQSAQLAAQSREMSTRTYRWARALKQFFDRIRRK